MYESSSTYSQPISLWMLSPDPGALKAWPWLPVDEAIKSSPQFFLFRTYGHTNH